MTEYLDIVKENENYRVRLEYDDSGEKPYDEGAVPILSREFRGYSYRFEGVNEQGKAYEDAVTDAWNRFNHDDDVLARWLRIFYGAYSVIWDSSENNAYLAFDTAAWREKVGLSDEWMNYHLLDRQTLAEGSLSEVMAWANGEVFGWILERRLVTHTTHKDPVTGETVKELESEDWEVMDSCWGFFGDKYAREAAAEEFDRVAE